jgi:hypothetical protein
MHFTYVVILFLNLFVPQLQESPIDKAAELIRRNEIHQLASEFAATVEVHINDSVDAYPRAEAEKVVTDFFKRNRPEQLKVLHRIESSGNFRFGVYIVNTSGGAYRVAISFKKAEGAFKVSELRIESEKTK